MRFIPQRHWEPSLVLLAALLWLPGTGGNAFLSDDIDHITTWGRAPATDIWRWFYTEYFNYYRPLTALLWKIEYSLWEFELIGYQLVNIALHVGCALLLRELGRLLRPGDNRTGLVAALIFLFLPGHIFGVLMVSALTGLLCSLLYLAAAVAHLHTHSDAHSIRFRILGPAFFLLALLTKELALSLPLLIGLWEIIRQRDEHRLDLAEWFRALLPYGLVFICYLLWRWCLFGQMPHSPLHANPTLPRLLVNTSTYAAKGLAPWGLEGLKPFFRGHQTALLLCGGAGLLGVLGALWRWRRSVPAAAVYGLAWFSVSVLPVLSLYSPWNTYLPAAGSALAIAALLDGPNKVKRYALILFLTLSVIYSLTTQQHWLRARTLCAQVTAAVADLEADGPIYLANLPAEWNDVPLFISDWALRGTLRWRGRDREITALANVVKTRRDEQLDIRPTGESGIFLRLLDPGDFFRLESMEILAGVLTPAIGYTYHKGPLHIRVMGLGAHGQANALEVELGSADLIQHVHYWDGQDLLPLVARP